MQATLIKDLFASLHEGTLAEGDIKVEGWVRTNRDSGKIGFLSLNDGTSFLNLQAVYDGDSPLYQEMKKVRTGAAVSLTGKLVITPNAPQPFELKVTGFELIGDVADDYPLQKKRHSFEFLREIAHLRPRTNTFNALYRVRSVLAYAIHSFFFERGFVYVHTPEITTNDAEGAGQSFEVVTRSKNPYTDFYGVPASLTVSGQLHVEPFALTYRNVYTFGPTFRAEKSNTPRHASEFWMIEPEMAFCDLRGDMAIIEALVKHCIAYVEEHCPDEMDFFDKFVAKGLKEKLHKVLHSEFKVMTYSEAIVILEKAVKEGHHFDYSKIEWGMDLQSEHERYLTEVVVGGPVFLIDYPKEIKAFYMKENPDGKTVAACDLLVPEEGEIVGGSQREDIYEVLKAKMEKAGNIEGLSWYLDLRRYGGCPHSGFGLGFDRFLSYLTGMGNIRDTEPYPRNYGNLKY